ncbi:kinase-regulated stress-responsive transcription factor skn7 [Rhodotorula toruloides]
MHDSSEDAQHAGEGDASAQERDEGAATLEGEEESVLAMGQEDSVGVEYEQEELAQSASAPTTPSHASTVFPPLPNWAQLQASVSSPPKPAEGEGGASRRRSFADAGESGGVEEEGRGRTIYSVPVPSTPAAGVEGVAKVPIPAEGGGEEGGGQGGSRPTLTDYCVRDLALEAVRQAQIAEQEARMGEKRARSSSEDAEGEEDTGHPFAYPYPPPQTSYVHGLPHFSPPFTTSGAGYQPYNPHSPICPPPPASTPTTQAGRAVWGLSSTSAMALGVYGSSSSAAAAWRYDPTHALQQQQQRGGYGGYGPITSVPPLQPPVLPPIQNQGQGYFYPRPSPHVQQQENAAYDSDEEESQRFESASSASPATTRPSVGSPATSIATPRAAPRQPTEEKEAREKEVPLVSGEGGAVKLEHTPQQLVPIAPAPVSAPQQEVAQAGAAGGGEIGGKRKGGRGVTPKNAFTIDPIQGVKPFIVKLRWLLMHPEIAGDVVCWSEDGHSVLVKVGGDTSRLTEDILPRTFAHSNIAAFQQGQFVSYGFTSLKGADLTAALHQSSPPASSSVASTSAPHLPAFGPSAPNPSPSPAAARDPKEWRAYTHLHTPSDALRAKNEEEGGEEWEDEEWWFEREGMEDVVCLGRLKAKGKGGGAGGGGGGGRTSTAGSAGGRTQGQGAGGSGVQQGQGGAAGGTQGQSGVQGLLASFKLPNNGGGGT